MFVCCESGLESVQIGLVWSVDFSGLGGFSVASQELTMMYRDIVFFYTKRPSRLGFGGNIGPV